MTKRSAIAAIVLALVIGFFGGYFSNLFRYPWQHRRLSASPSGATPTPRPLYRPLHDQVAKARQLHAEGKALKAQQLLREQLRAYPQAAGVTAARELLGTINTELFFSKGSSFGKTEYVVKRGDSLSRIAGQLSSTPEMIMRANDLSSTMIQPGKRLVVPDGDFTLTVDLPNDRVVVHHGDGYFKQYPIQHFALPASSQPRLSTKVMATTLWKDGESVSPTAPTRGGATPWVHLSRPGYILYGVSEDGEVEPGPVELANGPEKVPGLPGAPPLRNAPDDPDIPPLGIALLRDDLAELELLIRRGTPVNIIRAAR